MLCNAFTNSITAVAGVSSGCMPFYQVRYSRTNCRCNSDKPNHPKQKPRNLTNPANRCKNKVVNESTQNTTTCFSELSTTKLRPPPLQMADAWVGDTLTKRRRLKNTNGESLQNPCPRILRSFDRNDSSTSARQHPQTIIILPIMIPLRCNNPMRIFSKRPHRYVIRSGSGRKSL